MKKLIAIVAVTMAALSMLVTGPSPAAAHYTYGYHGKDFASVGRDDQTISICDREGDGHDAYVLVERGDFDIIERDGPDRGCDTVFVTPVWFFKVYVCEETKGCVLFHT